ncbi:hypothetical protein Emed_003733 [Eimeria media]
MPDQRVFSKTPLTLQTISSQNNNVLDNHEFLSNGVDVETTTSANRWKTRSKDFLKLSSALRFIAIGAIAMLLTFSLHSICSSVKSNIVEGMHGRRLAEGGSQEDDDFSPPTTPELLDLCIELEGELDPGKSPPETPRASPLMVASFFDNLAAGEGPADSAGFSLQGSGTPPSSSFSRKRHASGNIEDDGGFPSTSWKLPKEDSTPPHLVSPKKSSPVSDADPGSSSLQPPLSTGSPDSFDSQDLLEFVASTLEQYESSGVLPSGVEEVVLPSSAEPPVDASAAPRGDGGFVHPWVRVPSLEPGETPKQFLPERMTLSLMARYHADIMLWMRQSLRKETLRTQEASQLVISAEMLANNAFHTMRNPVSSKRLTVAVETLGRRFMVFYVLHLTSKTVGQPWQQQAWWRDLANAIPTECPYAAGTLRTKAKSQPLVNLATQLSAALEKYKNGSAPGDDEVVTIMRKLFCSRECPRDFQNSLWDPWRHDDQPSPPKI